VEVEEGVQGLWEILVPKEGDLKRTCSHEVHEEGWSTHRHDLALHHENHLENLHDLIRTELVSDSQRTREMNERSRT
jgi:hypothetical protein